MFMKAVLYNDSFLFKKHLILHISSEHVTIFHTDLMCRKYDREEVGMKGRDVNH